MTRILVFLLAVVLAAQVSAQPLLFRLSPENQNILLDYAAFPSSASDQVRLEVYYQVYNSALPFRKVGQIMKAEYEVAIQVVDNDNHSAAFHNVNRSVQVANINRARSHTDYRIDQANFEIPAGEYKLKFILSDKHSEATIKRELKLHLKSFETSKAKLSDIEFVQTAKSADSARNDFFKANMEIVPSLLKWFGADGSNRLMFYIEINRSADSCSKVFIETELRHDRHGILYCDTLQTTLERPITCQLREISLDEFRQGEYELIIRLNDQHWKKLDKKTASFEVSWNQTNLLKYEYEEAVDQLEFIAEPGETEKLEEINGYEKRLSAFNEFWSARDPNPSTKINELKIRFYHLINIANRMFTIMGHRGWRTDRGRILIQYGVPDQVDDYPFAIDRPSYQNWHYYEKGEYLKFTFVDKYDNGDYQLVYPYNGLDRRPDF
ncbi:MAG: GWxTD domain-containing protein [candidate division Zixibacteria bacterium]|nr:GWxTD domain-containing protein [candidate division Zixibacteria bacterium]